jgi:predicted MFS family arabinose efflux permease
MLAGLLLAVAPIAMVFLINGVSYLPLIIALVLLPGVRLSESADRLESGPPLLEGARYAWRHRQLRALLGLAAASGGLLMPFLGIFMALFVKNELGGAERELGVVMTGNGVGALAGALLMMRISASRRGVFIVGSAAVSGALLWVLSICAGAWAAAALVTAMALSTALTTGLAATQIQLSVSPEFRGRVTSLCSVAMTASMPIGAIAIGMVSDSLSMRPTIRLCAACYVTIALTWLLAAKIMDFHPDEVDSHRRDLSPSILP